MRRHPIQRSKLVPYKPGESGSARHERRLNVSARHMGEVKEWCERNGVTLKIHNHGHHWVFKKDGQVGEWWPSSAKMVYNREYDKELHLHDFAAVIQSLRKWFFGRR